MAQSKALLKVLNNDEEPLSKRIKIADNAFKSTELSVNHKEALLLKWLINNSKNVSHEVVWTLTSKWLSSEQFRNLTQNDITNDDISAILELFLKQLVDINKENAVQRKEMVNGVLLVCDNKVFQQYFKYNLELYCRFLSITLEKIDSSYLFIEFLKQPCLYSKNFLVEKTFYKHFLSITFSTLVRKELEFKDNPDVFIEISKIVQKCIFNGNTKKFDSFFAQCLEGQITEKQHILVPKALFKYLASTYDDSTEVTSSSFKITFHAFSQASSESILLYKYLILVVHMLQIDIKPNFNVNSPVKLKDVISLSKAAEIIFSILDVLSTRSFRESEVSNKSFTEFLREILKVFLSLQLRSPTFYKIILKCISINPLIIEPIASLIVIFVMIANNDENKDYESVVVEVFNVFSKLHRTENFIAKIIPALKNSIMGEEIMGSLKNVYQFTGKYDVELTTKPVVTVSDMFSENILQCFTNSINGLASWQVINVFKTLLFHLKATVNEYTEQKEQGELFDSSRHTFKTMLIWLKTLYFVDPNILTFLEILGTLNNRLLQSVKIADHTIPQNVILKLLKGMQELQDILKDFGLAILNREHNHITMRTFLNISYVWGETYIILGYYSNNDEVQMTTLIGNTYTACNLTYLHSYLDVKQWQLISQRITNFGETPCKNLLQKLYIQKLRAMLLFEKNFNSDILTNIVKALQTQPEDTWKDLLLDKFAVKFILPKMDKASLTSMSEHLIEDDRLHEVNHIRDSVSLTNALAYVVMSKINKLFIKHKRKHDEEFKKNLSSQIFALIPADIFFTSEDYDMNEVIDNIKILFENRENGAHLGVESKEDKILNYLKKLKKFPIIYSSTYIQESVLLYLVSLYGDILSCSQQTKQELESLIIGILQNCKYQLTDIFKIEILGTYVLTYFQKYDVIFSLIIDNVFRTENCIKQFEPLVRHLIKNLEDQKCLSSTLLVLQAVYKIRKSKMDSSFKEIALSYKEKILKKLSKLVCKSEYLIEAYGTCLKHYLAFENDTEILKKLLDKLASYIQYSLENINNQNKKDCVILFTTVLHNKQKIENINEDIVLKVWNACKKIEIGDEYSHLMKLIVTMIPNDEFHLLVEDLLKFTENNIKNKNYDLLARQLKTWESILTCDVNPIKMKVWRDVLEQLIQKLLDMLKNCEYDKTLFANIVHLEESIIQTQRFILSPPLIDMFIITVSILMQKENQYFETTFILSITMLEKLLKHRNAMIMDRLPAFLQQYRIVLNNLCDQSNSEQNTDVLDLNKASDCAHKLEKLTKNLVSCKKDMERIAAFLIADILERYEQINLYPNVKLHLNNCIYSLISLCDHHSVSYLMRVLSTASTEMFKILYEHYKKYYMFTGKV